ncbi:MAG: hypothetical protein Q8Q59_05555 [Luteolibacter sp.]|jgi:opacity protein-like surface antigen|nr:hypothetical protein [Luteolibacter sp.]
MKSSHSTLVASILALAAVPAFAGSTAPSITVLEPVASTPDWHWHAALYGWATGLNGDIAIKGIDAPVDVGFSDIFDHLDFAAMGLVEIGRGRWNFAADLFYAELGANTTRRDIDFDAELDQFIGNFAVAYSVIDTGCTHFAVYAGARVTWMETEIDIDFPNIADRSLSASKSWVDPIIGVRFQQELSEKFFLRTVGDIGGFGISSDFTWQAFAAFGYRITENGSILLGYRGIGSDYSDGDFTYDVITHGVLLGFEYRF